MPYSVMVSGFLPRFVVSLVLLNVVCFLSIEVGLCSVCDGCCVLSDL